jgi:hypothetical protein
MTPLVSEDVSGDQSRRGISPEGRPPLGLKYKSIGQGIAAPLGVKWVFFTQKRIIQRSHDAPKSPLWFFLS